ncbi:MAG: hypothetical protein CV087_22250 [Candidatus Brocadia sp. WS118]|nr:MAG: hypothetical protein CV087_22250 [Candidatus Brocadia sp. WS118]
MKNNEIEIYAESLDKAQYDAYSQIPKDCIILREEIINDGLPKEFIGKGLDTKTARKNALDQFSKDVEIYSEEVVSEFEKKLFTIKAFSEIDAQNEAKKRVSVEYESINCEQVKQGSKKLFSKGRKPNVYKASCIRYTKVKFKLKDKAYFRVIYGKAADNSHLTSYIESHNISRSAKHVVCGVFGWFTDYDRKLDYYVRFIRDDPGYSKLEDDSFSNGYPRLTFFDFSLQNDYNLQFTLELIEHNFKRKRLAGIVKFEFKVAAERTDWQCIAVDKNNNTISINFLNLRAIVFYSQHKKAIYWKKLLVSLEGENERIMSLKSQLQW